MPCHVPATSISSRRRPPLLSSNPPAIAATLNLSIPGEREAHDLVRRFGSGRWPLWRIIDLRRQRQTLYVAVEWRRCREPGPYSVVAVSLDEIALRWRYVPNATAARATLDRLGIRHRRQSHPVVGRSRS